MKRASLLILIILSLTLAFEVGYILGAREVQSCEARNQMLFDDLSVAVKRGVILETNLSLCKEQQKK